MGNLFNILMERGVRMESNRKYSSLNSVGDCKNIIDYLHNILKCPDMFYESGAMKSNLFYGQKKVDYFILPESRGPEIWADIVDEEPKFICRCNDTQTAEFIISSLRHSMPRYWDTKVIEDDSRKNCT